MSHNGNLFNEEARDSPVLSPTVPLQEVEGTGSHLQFKMKNNLRSSLFSADMLCCKYANKHVALFGETKVTVNEEFYWENLHLWTRVN